MPNKYFSDLVKHSSDKGASTKAPSDRSGSGKNGMGGYNTSGKGHPLNGQRGRGPAEMRSGTANWSCPGPLDNAFERASLGKKTKAYPVKKGL